VPSSFILWVQKFGPFFVLYLAYTYLVLSSLENIFFWDTVQLGSKHAHHFYNMGFTQWLLPNEIDSGHIPIFGVYLAACWSIFGKTLAVSHLCMIPFVLGIVYQTINLVKNYTSGSKVIIFSTIVLLDPTLIAQCTLISPDVCLVFFFVWALNIIVKDKKRHFQKIIALLFLSIISNRGAMIVLGLFIFDVSINTTAINAKRVIIKLSHYLPAFLVFGSYMLYHYFENGWIGYHIDSPWAPCFEKVDLSGFLKNLVVLVWRLLDFGRISWYVIILSVIILRRKMWSSDPKIRQLIELAAIILGVMAYSFLGHVGLNSHRYIMPVYIIVALLGCKSISLLSSQIWRNVSYTVAFISLILGHTWVYPKTLSQGWDASLAHRPYFELRDSMVSYIRDQNILFESIASYFPNNNQYLYLNLSSDLSQHPTIDIGKTQYILWSNIYNDIDENKLQTIKSMYLDVKTIEKRGITVTLFQKK
jgi:hypothetical protein